MNAGLLHAVALRAKPRRRGDHQRHFRPALRESAALTLATPARSLALPVSVFLRRLSPEKRTTGALESRELKLQVSCSPGDRRAVAERPETEVELSVSLQVTERSANPVRAA
jgi:hypothetical protein